MFGAQDTLDAVAHIIQVSLTPVFLLSGIATLLNVFSTRLSRVADRVEALSKALDDASPAQAKALAVQLGQLHRRSLALDTAVVLAAIGGAATCGAVLALLVSELGKAPSAWILFSLFGLAVVCALGAIAAFTAEMLISGTGIRAEVAQSQRSAEEDEAAVARGERDET